MVVLELEFGFGSIAFLFLLGLYESARLFYWSDVSSRLVNLNNATLNSVGIFINSSNVTDYVAQINKYATTYPKYGSYSPASIVAQWLGSANILVIPILIIVWGLSIYISWEIIKHRANE